MLRPSAVDVLQEFSVFVFVSYMTQASYQRPTCHGLRFSQGISLILQSCREERGAERPLGSSEEIFATLAALAHGVGFHCHSFLTPLFPPRYLSAALHANLLFPDLACRLFVLLHHPLHTCTLSSSFSSKILETSVWKEQQIHVFSLHSCIPRGSCQGGWEASQQGEEAGNSEQKEQRSKLACLCPLELSRLGTRN